MIRQSALVGLTPNICATRMIAKPHSASAVHHHGEQDTVVFAFGGHGAVVSEGGKKRQELAPGDFALIPAWAEHQEVNDGEEEVSGKRVLGEVGDGAGFADGYVRSYGASYEVAGNHALSILRVGERAN